MRTLSLRRAFFGKEYMDKKEKSKEKETTCPYCLGKEVVEEDFKAADGKCYYCKGKGKVKV
jgi:hypothetical protein